MAEVSIVLEPLRRDGATLVLVGQLTLTPELQAAAAAVRAASRHSLVTADGSTVPVVEIEWTDRHCFSEHPVLLVGIIVAAGEPLACFGVDGPESALVRLRGVAR